MFLDNMPIRSINQSEVWAEYWYVTLVTMHSMLAVPAANMLVYWRSASKASEWANDLARAKASPRRRRPLAGDETLVEAPLGAEK